MTLCVFTRCACWSVLTNHRGPPRISVELKRGPPSPSPPASAQIADDCRVFRHPPVQIQRLASLPRRAGSRSGRPALLAMQMKHHLWMRRRTALCKALRTPKTNAQPASTTRVLTQFSLVVMTQNICGMTDVVVLIGGNSLNWLLMRFMSLVQSGRTQEQKAPGLLAHSAFSMIRMSSVWWGMTKKRDPLSPILSVGGRSPVFKTESGVREDVSLSRLTYRRKQTMLSFVIMKLRNQSKL